MTTYGGSRWVGLLQYAIAAPFQALYRILLYIVGYNGPTSPLTGAAKSNNPTAAPSKVRRAKQSGGHHGDRVRHVRINLLNRV